MFYPNDVPVFPLGFANIHEQQQNDSVLLALLNDGVYTLEQFHGHELICNLHNNQHKIVLPEAMHEDTIKWYHFVLGHVGIKQLIQSLTTFFYIVNLKTQVENFVATCDACQCYKQQNHEYGHLSPQQDVSIPWEENAVDLIGPWPVKIEGLGEMQIRALTVVDTHTTLSELIHIETILQHMLVLNWNKLGYHVILDHSDVSMIQVQNLWVLTYKVFFNIWIFNQYKQL